MTVGKYFFLCSFSPSLFIHVLSFSCPRGPKQGDLKSCCIISINYKWVHNWNYTNNAIWYTTCTWLNAHVYSILFWSIALISDECVKFQSQLNMLLSKLRSSGKHEYANRNRFFKEIRVLLQIVKTDYKTGKSLGKSKYMLLVVQLVCNLAIIY